MLTNVLKTYFKSVWKFPPIELFDINDKDFVF